MIVFQFSYLQPLFDAEFPFGNNVMVVGPPGIGKTVMCECLVSECLKNKNKVLYVTLDRHPEFIRKRMEVFRIPTDEMKFLMFVDGYSWRIGGGKEQYRIKNLSNLSDLSVKMNSANGELGEKSFLVFDSISTLLTYNQHEDVSRFLDINMARMKRNGSLSMWLVDEGIHKESFYNMTRHISDGVIEMCFKDIELKRFIRIHTLRGMSHPIDWNEFVIDTGGKFTIINGLTK